MRRASKVDTTHSSIRDGLREAGFSVIDTHTLGKDFPDMVVGKHGHTLLVEAKTPKGRKSAAARLSEGQKTFAQEWRGSPVVPAYCLDDVLFAFGRQIKKGGWMT